MAKIDLTAEARDNVVPPGETFEVRVWGLAGERKQMFLIGSGFNFTAEGNIWLEFIHTVHGAQLFYTRNFLHYSGDASSTPALLTRLEAFAAGQGTAFGFGDMLPQTELILKRQAYTSGETTYYDYDLDIAVDVGAVFLSSAPGENMHKLHFESVALEAGVQFMREFTHELEAAYQGKHPNPADLPPHSSDWSFSTQINRQAYHLISQNYQEKYFQNPVLTAMFDEWAGLLPAGGRVLDAGCGHGYPVIARLLEKEFRVTGIDLSPSMLERARAAFPKVSFHNIPVAHLEQQAEYDGACSLSSLLYLDPIDLSFSLHRLYGALEPGGLLFLYAQDLHPTWRGIPFSEQIHQWMWSWTYSLDEAVQALEEHGFFKALQAQDVTTAEDKEQRLSSWKKEQQEGYETYLQHLPPDQKPKKGPDLSSPPRMPYAYAIIARRAE